ncbi:MAG: cytochrome C oxidase subunit IV family protein [Dehalococcoidia bacterium]
MTTTEHHESAAHEGLGPRQYVTIFAILTVVTVIELWLSYSDIGGLLIPLLILLSAFKFVVVVAYFMHLRFEPRILNRLFAGGFVLATLVLFALISLFWNDITHPLG